MGVAAVGGPMKVNVDDLEWTERERGETAFRRKALADAAGGEAIGASLYELAPGDRSWPYHYHEANAEALFVLAGRGTLRLAGDRVPLTEGDYVPFPPGEEHARRVINDADGPLRYLMLSTMEAPDLTVYPDSGKFGVYAGAAPGSRDERTLEGYYYLDDDVDYWAGEED